MFGGERGVLMSRLVNDFSIVPPSIELLFNNEKLDTIKFLCLLYAFSLITKRHVKIAELLFYYGIVNFNLYKLFDENIQNSNSVSDPSINLYFRFQSKLPKIIINLTNLNLIDFKGDFSKKKEELTLKISSEGQVLIKEIDSEFFLELIDKYNYVINSIKYTTHNLKILTEGKE